MSRFFAEFIGTLVLVLFVHLLPALFAGLLVFELVHLAAPYLSARLSHHRSKLVVVALLRIQHSAGYMLFRDRFTADAMRSAVGVDVGIAALWLVLTPLVLFLARAVPLRRAHLALRRPDRSRPEDRHERAAGTDGAVETQRRIAGRERAARRGGNPQPHFSG